MLKYTTMHFKSEVHPWYPIVLYVMLYLEVHRVLHLIVDISMLYLRSTPVRKYTRVGKAPSAKMLHQGFRKIGLLLVVPKRQLSFIIL
jgi:hypothetical protein